MTSKADLEVRIVDLMHQRDDLERACGRLTAANRALVAGPGQALDAKNWQILALRRALEATLQLLNEQDALPTSPPRTGTRHDEQR